MKNWKTSVMGAGMILTALGTLCFAVSKGALTQDVVTGFMTALAGGVGLIFAGDAAKS